jgi:hypothetical protein
VPLPNECCRDHVEFYRVRVAALAFDARAQVLESLDASARQNDSGPSARKRHSKLRA